jgi:hypothetical protein
MSIHETPLTRKFWEENLGGEGSLYEEFRAVEAAGEAQSWRDIDGVVVLGDRPGRCIPRGRRSLNDQDVVVIQTKAAPLNPYVFGQALLSRDLICRRWTPSSIRSVLICTADDPELRSITDEFPEVEVEIMDGHVGSFGLSRIAGAAMKLADQRNMAVLKAPAQLARRFRIDGVLAPALETTPGTPVAEQVAGKDVISVHSERNSRGPKRLGMWIAGEIIVAQRLLAKMGAASTHSLVLCQKGDRAVERELSNYATVEVVRTS